MKKLSEPKKKPSVAARVTAAIFIGLTIGMFGGVGLYLMSEAVNAFTAVETPIIPSVAFLLLGLGGATVGSIGMQLTYNIRDTENASIGHKVTRAIFMGMTIGIFGGAGFWILAEAVNIFTGTTVLSSVGFLLLGLGGSILGAIGIELSGELQT